MSFDVSMFYVLPSFVFLLLLFPATLFFIFNFHRKRNEISVAKRYPQLALITGIFFSSAIFFMGSVIFFYGSKLHIIINAIVMVLMIVHYSILTSVFVLRYWLLYYNICLSKSLLNMEWLNVINPFRMHECCHKCEHDTKYDNIESFFIQNKCTYGNVSFMSNKCIKYVLCVGCPIWILFAVGDVLYYTEYSVKAGKILMWISFIIHFLSFMLPSAIFLISLWRHLLKSAFYDALYVEKELKLLLCTKLFCYFLTFLFGAIAMVMKVDYFHPGQKDFLFFFIDFSISTLFAFFNIIITLAWVPYKLSQKEKREQSYYNTSGVSCRRKRREKLNKKLVKRMEKARLLDILPDIQMFEAFMQLLAKEFCTESLLSVVEFTQYQNYMMKICNELDFDNNKNSGKNKFVYVANNTSLHSIKSSRTYTDTDIDEDDTGYNSAQLRAFSLPSSTRASTNRESLSNMNVNSLSVKNRTVTDSASAETYAGLILPRLSIYSIVGNGEHVDGGILPSMSSNSASVGLDLQSVLSINSNSDSTPACILRLVLPDEIPQSLIVYPGKGHTGECIQALLDKGNRINCSGGKVKHCSRSQLLYCSKKKAYLLYNKYIECRAEYEINIAYAQRVRYHGMMHDFEEFVGNEDIGLLDLTTIFDGCVQDMFRLMMQAFSRFKNSIEFERLYIARHKSNNLHPQQEN